MEGIVQDELSIGTDLRVVSGLELSIPHMILLHPHERGARVRFGVAVVPSLKFIFPSCSGHDFLIRLIFGFHFLVNIHHSSQNIIYLSECLFHFFLGNILIYDGSGVTQILLSDELGVPPYLLKLFRDSGNVGVDGFIPDERIVVGVHFHLRPVGAGHVHTYKTFRHEELHDGGEDGLERIFQPAAAKAVDGVVVRIPYADQLHEVDITAVELLNAAAGIDIAQIGISRIAVSYGDGRPDSL